MNIGQLKSILADLPDDMELLNERYSDYDLVLEEDWSLVKAVPQDTGYIMRSHPTMGRENKAKEKLYLLLKGN